MSRLRTRLTLVPVRISGPNARRPVGVFVRVPVDGRFGNPVVSQRELDRLAHVLDHREKP